MAGRYCQVCGVWLQRLPDGAESIEAHYRVVHPGRTVGDRPRKGDWSVLNG